MRSILPHGKKLPEWCPMTLMLHPYWGRIYNGQDMHQRGVPSLLMSTFQSLENATVLFFFVLCRCAIPVDVDFPMMEKHNNIAFFVANAQSLLRSTFQWKWKAPEWCSVKLKYAILVEVDTPMTEKCTRVVPCEIEVHDPDWSPHSRSAIPDEVDHPRGSSHSWPYDD